MSTDDALRVNRRKAMRPPVMLCALACGALAAGGALTASPALAAASVSTNWAGYVALPSASVGARFSSVSGTWTQPSATCSAGRETYSATWIGLGGYAVHARALEQIGTDTDCTRSGSAVYSGWYELLPAGPVNLKLKVHAGDQMSASVTVKRHGVTLRIRDLSTGRRFSTTRRMTRIDTASAEWIVEAPSACVSSETCQILPLTDFGEVAFSAATATARAHTGPIADPDWSSLALELQQRSFGAVGGPAGTRAQPTRTLILATPSSPPSSAGAFSVSWREQSIQLEQPASPTTPPSSGGGPT
jgi:hypothetical protein